MTAAEPYIYHITRRFGRRVVSAIGYDAAYTEALTGAMKGIVAWLLRDGPAGLADTPKVQTFILRGVQYHFGCLLTARRRTRVLPPLGTVEGSNPLLARPDSGTDAVDSADAVRFIAALVTSTADRIDPSGEYRRVIDLRHGLTNGVPLTFAAIADRWGIRKQAAHARYKLAIVAVRAALAGVRIDAAAGLD